MSETKSTNCIIHKVLDGEEHTIEIDFNDRYDKLSETIRYHKNAIKECEHDLGFLDLRNQGSLDKIRIKKGEHLQTCQNKQCQEILARWKQDAWLQAYVS